MSITTSDKPSISCPELKVTVIGFVFESPFKSFTSMGVLYEDEGNKTTEVAEPTVLFTSILVSVDTELYTDPEVIIVGDPNTNPEK